MQARLASVLRGALLTGLYFAGAVIAVFYLRTPSDVTLFWPAAGIGRYPGRRLNSVGMSVLPWMLA